MRIWRRRWKKKLNILQTAKFIAQKLMHPTQFNIIYTQSYLYCIMMGCKRNQIILQLVVDRLRCGAPNKLSAFCSENKIKCLLCLTDWNPWSCIAFSASCFFSIDRYKFKYNKQNKNQKKKTKKKLFHLQINSA